MAATKGNSFWKQRQKHGRDKIFASPDALWSAACEYFAWCDTNPWRIEKTKKKGKSKEVESTPTQRPYTIAALCMYLGVHSTYLNDLKDKDYSEVITRIRQIIETNQIEGAMVGAYNANIVSRINGLTDKMDIESGGEKLKAVIQVQVVNTGVPLASSEDEIKP